MNKAELFTRVFKLFVVLSGILFLVLLFFSKPEDGNGTKALFFAVITIFVWTSVSLIAFYLKKKITNNELIYVNIKSSIRQGLFSGLLVLGTLSLAAIRILTWWDVLLLAFSIILLELYFKSERVSG